MIYSYYSFSYVIIVLLSYMIVFYYNVLLNYVLRYVILMFIIIYYICYDIPIVFIIMWCWLCHSSIHPSQVPLVWDG